MKKLNKKGFTMVELVIVIVIIGVLAAVLIPTFGGIIRKANDSAYQQDRTNQMIQDAIEKIDKGNDNYMSWEDFEEAIAKALKDQSTDNNLVDKIIAIIKDNDKETGMTAEQLAKILDAIANKKFSDTQVKVILDGVKYEDTSLTQEQLDQIIAKLPQVGITQEDITAAVNAVLGNGSDLANAINGAIEAAVGKIPTLSKDDIARIIEEVLAVNLEKDGKYVARIGTVGYESLEDAVAEADDNDTIDILRDIRLEETLTVAKAVTINGNSHNVTFAGTNDYFIKTNTSISLSDITIDGGGKTIGLDGTININSYNVLDVSSGTVVLNNVTVNAQHSVDAWYRIAWVQSGATLTLQSGVTFDSGRDDTHDCNYMAYGGLVYNDGTLVINSGATLQNGKADNGGAIYNTGTVEITGGTICNNTAAKYGYGGGAIYNTGTVELTGGTICNNTAAKYGGAIYNEGTVEITGGTILSNNAYTGGGVYNFNTAVLRISGGSIESNVANTDGGGVLNNSTVNISGTAVIKGNKANNGAGIHNQALGIVTMTGGSIIENIADGNINIAMSIRGLGGGIYNAQTRFDATDGEIHNGMVVIQGGTIQNNQGNAGKDQYYYDDVYAENPNCVIIQNKEDVGYLNLGISTSSTERPDESPITIKKNDQLMYTLDYSDETTTYTLTINEKTYKVILSDNPQNVPLAASALSDNTNIITVGSTTSGEVTSRYFKAKNAGEATISISLQFGCVKESIPLFKIIVTE